MWRFIVSIFFCCLGVAAFAQKVNADYTLNITKTSTPPEIDGIANDPVWQRTDPAKDFFMVLPMDTSSASLRTEVRMTYDNQNIYLIAECYYEQPGSQYVVESLRRDWSFQRNDNFIFFIDTFDDQINGYTFGTNAAGAQWDATLFDGGGGADLSWDNKWSSAVRHYEDRYVFEMALPFKTIRYKKGIRRWGINFSRNDLKTTEKSAWAPVPRQFPTSSLAFTGILIWDEPPPPPRTNISLIPYGLGRMTHDADAGKNARIEAEVGTDAKIAVTSSLNLDLTVNPDFSQVEVDRQITNLDRFELFFPERRQFFLENGDLFANFGYPRIRPFFSRRIGLGVPILFGARLSGKINRDWRIGLMNMQTREVGSEALPAQNFSVLALQRRVAARSNIGLLATNKQSLNYTPPDDSSEDPVYSQYDRNLGIEYNLASANNQWTGKAMIHKSFNPDVTGRDITFATDLRYRTRQWNIQWMQEFVGKNYTAEMGYVPRTDYLRFDPEVSYTFFPSGSPILSHGPIVGSWIILNPEFELTDFTPYLGYQFTTRQRDDFLFWLAEEYVRILFPFDPTFSGQDSLVVGDEYAWVSWGSEITTRPQSLLTFSVSTQMGGYYEDGRRYSIATDLGYRFQPYVNVALSTSYNRIEMKEPWSTTVFWLVGPRIDVTFTNILYWTTFLQYNDQVENINLNTRLQWRYAPASDLFIVYTDNYTPDSFGVKNRALVVKLTYWWNL